MLLSIISDERIALKCACSRAAAVKSQATAAGSQAVTVGSPAPHPAGAEQLIAAGTPSFPQVAVDLATGSPPLHRATDLWAAAVVGTPRVAADLQPAAVVGPPSLVADLRAAAVVGPPAVAADLCTAAAVVEPPAAVADLQAAAVVEPSPVAADLRVVAAELIPPVAMDLKTVVVVSTAEPPATMDAKATAIMDAKATVVGLSHAPPITEVLQGPSVGEVEAVEALTPELQLAIAYKLLERFDMAEKNMSLSSEELDFIEFLVVQVDSLSSSLAVAVPHEAVVFGSPSPTLLDMPLQSVAVVSTASDPPAAMVAQVSTVGLLTHVVPSTCGVGCGEVWVQATPHVSLRGRAPHPVAVSGPRRSARMMPKDRGGSTTAAVKFKQHGGVGGGQVRARGTPQDPLRWRAPKSLCGVRGWRARA